MNSNEICIKNKICRIQKYNRLVIEILVLSSFVPKCGKVINLNYINSTEL